MIKKIIGAIGLVGGLGLALLVMLYFLTPAEEAPPLAPAPTPAVQPQGGGRPALESPPPAATPDSSPVVPVAAEPPGAAPAAAPAPPVAAIPAPEPAPQEKKVATAPPAKPQKEHGLLVGKYRTYSEAKRRMTRITKQKIPAFTRKQGKYYEVWAGPFGSSQEAARAQKSLKAAMKIAAQQKKIAVPVPK